MKIVAWSGVALTLAAATITSFTVNASAATAPGLELSVTINPRPAQVSQDVGYTVTVKNTSTSRETNGLLVVSIELVKNGQGYPPGIAYESPPCQGAAGSQACGRIVLQPGQARTYFFIARPDRTGHLSSSAAYQARNQRGQQIHVASPQQDVIVR